MSQTVLKINGMTWGHCVASVTRALMGINGVQDVKVDLASGQATVSHMGVGLPAMKTAVDDAGYEVTGAQ